jgi:hypothetical protein
MNPGTYAITNRWGLFAAGLNRHLNARTHVQLDNITTRGENHDFHSLYFSLPATGETGYFMFQAADPACHVRDNFCKTASKIQCKTESVRIG